MTRCLGGSQDAARELIDRFQRPVYGLCMRMVAHAQDAEDISQEVLLRCVRSLRSWNPLKPLRPWVLAIAANRCRTHLAMRRRRIHAAELIDDPPGRDSGSAAETDLVGELARALDTLRPEYRMAVVLFHEQQLSYEEMSDVMERPVGTIKTWLHRARVELARELAQRGYAHEVPKSYIADR